MTYRKAKTEVMAQDLRLKWRSPTRNRGVYHFCATTSFNIP